MYRAIAAVDDQFGLHKNYRIPWLGTDVSEVAADKEFFHSSVAGQILIYGRRTLEDMRGCIPSATLNIIISKTLVTNNVMHRGAKFCIVRSCEEAQCAAEKYTKIAKTTALILGGLAIYEWFAAQHLISEWLISRIPGQWDCTAHLPISSMPHYSLVKTVVHQTSASSIVVEHYTYKNAEEEQYLAVLKELYDRAIDPDVSHHRKTRAARCVSVFGRTLRFSLRDGRFPLLTTRRQFFRGIFEELMLYLRGQTDSKILEERGVNVWRRNTTRNALDALGLHDMPEGDMGHSYGHSMRHFGCPYTTCAADYTGKGFDQLADVIRQLRENPMSRRIIISLWEPNHASRAALPPCLYQYQFFVEQQKNGPAQLSCMATQRSSDYVLAGGWNIATIALFVYILAAHVGYTPGELIWNIGDAHLYTNNSMLNVAEQLQRQPHSWPRLTVLNKHTAIEDYSFEDMQLANYAPHPPLEFVMNG